MRAPPSVPWPRLTGRWSSFWSVVAPVPPVLLSSAGLKSGPSAMPWLPLPGSQFNTNYFRGCCGQQSLVFQPWGRAQWQPTSSPQPSPSPSLASTRKDSPPEQSLLPLSLPATSSYSPPISFSLPPPRGQTVITFMTVTLGGTGDGHKLLLFQTHRKCFTFLEHKLTLN